MGRPKTAAREPALAWTWSALALATLAYAVALVWRGGWPLAAEAGAVVVASQPFGKFVVFAAWHASTRFGVWELGWQSALSDIHVAFALAVVLGHARRAGRIGRWFDARSARARRLLAEYPGVRRLAFTGIVVFIVLPFGTGPLLGTCVARLLGFSRLRGAIAVSVGSAATSVLFCAIAAALGAEGEALLRNPWLALGVSVALTAVLAALWLAARRVLKRPAAKSRAVHGRGVREKRSAGPGSR